MIEQADQPKEPPKSRGAKEASRPRSVAADHSQVPKRKVTGPMSVYYYDYVADHARGDDLRAVERISALPGGEVIMYEILNLVDGKRTVQAIRDYLAASYGPVDVGDVSDYLRLLEKIGVVQFD